MLSVFLDHKMGEAFIFAMLLISPDAAIVQCNQNPM